eukprot:TRINITY_DN25584_c0_g1_i1.p1 TRINITY_DN25584_c0_g1~~TRINITY_DN25584_c0_g1_i1.p1  ORF type:complete len:749 (+),score=76.75 TRINITY_DN25584_c0_g1_i1:63-2309(+)
MAGGSGTFVLDVIEAKGLKKSLRDKTNPFVKVTFGASDRQGSPIEDTENPVWNNHFEFPVTKPTENLRIQVWDFQGGLDDLLGELKFEVGGRHAEGTRWWLLQPRPSGEVYLNWKYIHIEPKRSETPTATSPKGNSRVKSAQAKKGVHAEEEDDGTLGALHIEIVNGKNLQVAEFAESVTAYVVMKYGPVTVRTKTKKKTVNPYWNEQREYKPKEKDHSFHFEVFDEDENDRLVGTATFNLTLTPYSSTKGSSWLNLQDATAGGGGGGAGSSSRTGELLVRYRFVAKKKPKTKVTQEKDEDTEDVVLGYEPKITGATGVIPDKRLYIWFQLFDDHFFKIELLRKLLATFTRRERVKDKPGLPPGPPQYVDVPYANIDEIVEECWKCKTRTGLFCKIRAAAQQFKVSGTVVVPVEEEEKLKIKWKESSIMMNEIAATFKIEKSIKSLWNMFSYGVDEPTADMKRMTETRIGKRAYLTISVHVYCAIIPDLSRRLAKKIAQEEWNRKDGQAADHIDESFVFLQFVKDMAAFWCDTLTEYEYQTFLTALLPLLIKARREVGRTRSPRKRRANNRNQKKNTSTTSRSPTKQKDKTEDETKNEPPLSARSVKSVRSVLDTSAPAGYGKKDEPKKELTTQDKLAALLAAPSLVGTNKPKSPRGKKKKPQSANPATRKKSHQSSSSDPKQPASARRPSTSPVPAATEGTTETRMQIPSLNTPMLNNFNLQATGTAAGKNSARSDGGSGTRMPPVP